MSVKNWFSESFPVDSEALIKISSEPIPNHLKRWWWGLGGSFKSKIRRRACFAWGRYSISSNKYFM